MGHGGRLATNTSLYNQHYGCSFCREGSWPRYQPKGLSPRSPRSVGKLTANRSEQLHGLSTNPMAPLEPAPSSIPPRLSQSLDEHTQQAHLILEEFNVQGDLGLPVNAASSGPKTTDSVVASPKKLEEFTLFPTLPVELRLKIGSY